MWALTCHGASVRRYTRQSRRYVGEVVLAYEFLSPRYSKRLGLEQLVYYYMLGTDDPPAD